MRNLILKNTGERIHLMDKIKVEGFDYRTEKEPFFVETMTRYEAHLKYSSYINGPNNLDYIQETLLKEKLAKHISWQLYGDAERILDYLLEAAINKDFDSCLEAASCLKKEISGDFRIYE